MDYKIIGTQQKLYETGLAQLAGAVSRNLLCPGTHQPYVAFSTADLRIFRGRFCGIVPS